MASLIDFLIIVAFVWLAFHAWLTHSMDVFPIMQTGLQLLIFFELFRMNRPESKDES